jgi:hypothetical protein
MIDWKEQKVQIDANSIQTITLPRKGLFKTKDIPVYSYTPKVQIKGKLCYENTMKQIEPTPVLAILKGLGYVADVISTPDELQEFLEHIKTKMGN